MKTSVITCFKKFVTIKGRASRSEYWWFALFNVLVAFILEFCIGFIAGFLAWDDVFYTMIAKNGSNILFLVMLLPSICVAVRRLHDIDRRGWWLLLSPLFIIMHLFLDLLANIFLFGTLSIISIVVPVAGGLIFLIFLCKKGTEGDNRFGKDPLAE